MPILFGELVVELGYVTQEQLEEVIQMQKKGRSKLGQIMKYLLLLHQEQVDKVLEHQNNMREDRKAFGDIAIELRLITGKQRDEAIRYQLTSKGVLGDMLIEQGYLTRDQRDDVTRQQIQS